MKLFRFIPKLLCEVAILMAGVHTFLSITIAFFVVNGALTPGTLMYVDTNTPALADALQSAGIGTLVLAGLIYVRHRHVRST